MERDIFIEELTGFFFVYGILGREIEEHTIKKIIENSLEKIELVETLINKLNAQAKKCSYIDIEKLKELLLELERIRIELDFKDYKGSRA